MFLQWYGHPILGESHGRVHNRFCIVIFYFYLTDDSCSSEVKSDTLESDTALNKTVSKILVPLLKNGV